MLVVPIIGGGVVVAIIQSTNKLGGDAFSEDDEFCVSSYAKHVGLILASSA
jgi:hypothetical protein